MSDKAVMPATLLGENTNPLIEAWFEIAHLKQVFRAGWIQRDIDKAHCESVADHTFANAMLCLLLLNGRPELDALKVLRMALVHDVGEAYVGDITPADDVDREEKYRLEEAAMQKIFAKLPNGDQFLADWYEYAESVTPEAKFVKQIDKLELAMQSTIYGKLGLMNPMEFMDSVKTALKDDKLKQLFSDLESLN